MEGIRRGAAMGAEEEFWEGDEGDGIVAYRERRVGEERIL